MKITRFTFCILLAAIVWIVGCVSTTNPLPAWKADLDENPNQTIVKDYQDYIQKLPPKERNYIGPVFYLEDGTGQHAISVEVFVKGKNASWHYAIIYDKENKRVKVIKYGYARYQS
jgi:hypothetical protein